MQLLKRTVALPQDCQRTFEYRRVARRRAQAGASLLQLGLAALGGTAITNRS